MNVIRSFSLLVAFFSLYVVAAAAAAAFETHVYCYLDVIFAFCQYSFCSDVYVFLVFHVFCMQSMLVFRFSPICLVFFVFLKVVVYSV